MKTISLPAEAVRNLVAAVRGFLNNDDGCDDRFIELMEEHVSAVERKIGQASKPALKVIHTVQDLD